MLHTLESTNSCSYIWERYYSFGIKFQAAGVRYLTRLLSVLVLHFRFRVRNSKRSCVCCVCVCFVLGQIIHEETNNNENILKDQETVVFSLYLHQSNWNIHNSVIANYDVSVCVCVFVCLSESVCLFERDNEREEGVMKTILGCHIQSLLYMVQISSGSLENLTHRHTITWTLTQTHICTQTGTNMK